MTRPADEQHRSDLLDRILDYVKARGVIDLSLRPLAKAVRSSPRVLLYYFKSKDEMIAEVVARARERQRQLFERIAPPSAASPVDACRTCWAIMSAPSEENAFRLFFEIYSLAIKDPKRYAGFLRGAVEDWLAYIEEPGIRAGQPRAQARAFATVVLAGYRGFMMDLCATHDRARIDRAVDLWLQALESLPGAKLRRRPRRKAS
jgi:AcrR family transcriptional regulator